MLKKLQKSDLLFIVGMVLVLLMHLACIFGPDHFADESFFPTIPFRLINGDSLISDEWHVTQFSSLFLYFPVRLWLAVKGSTEGIIVFLRFFYLVIHTLVSVAVYSFFRKHKIWAVAGALMFYSQVPLRFLNANYHSVHAIFLLFFTLALISLYDNKKTHLYLIAGFCYGCCCVNNPFLCLLFGVYIIVCIIWHIQKTKYKKNCTNLSYEEAFAKTQKSEIKNRFFSSNAFLKFFAGLCIAIIICVLFFLSTGGNFSEVLKNIPYLLQDTGHDIVISPFYAFIKKLFLSARHFNTISLNLPFLLPLFFIILLIDKKRYLQTHKLRYVIISFLLAVFYTVGVLLGALSCSRCLAMAFPFAIISTTCYILTENKNKKLFYCMWLPVLIAQGVQYIASDLHLSCTWMLTISNIAGVFFLKDFIFELKSVEKKEKRFRKDCQVILCIAICLQLVFQCCIYLIGRTVSVNKDVELEKGPYAGLLLDRQSFDRNHYIMNDLDTIKSLTDTNDPVLIISELSWMYLYIDRPFATYSAWQPVLEVDRLVSYYKENPEKTPKYIYVCWIFIPTSVTSGHQINKPRANNLVKEITETFNCEVSELSNGFLLALK